VWDVVVDDVLLDWFDSNVSKDGRGEVDGAHVDKDCDGRDDTANPYL
jgi:hypothetical protein